MVYSVYQCSPIPVALPSSVLRTTDTLTADEPVFTIVTFTNPSASDELYSILSKPRVTAVIGRHLNSKYTTYDWVFGTICTSMKFCYGLPYHIARFSVYNLVGFQTATCFSLTVIISDSDCCSVLNKTDTTLSTRQGKHCKECLC